MSRDARVLARPAHDFPRTHRDAEWLRTCNPGELVVDDKAPLLAAERPCAAVVSERLLPVAEDLALPLGSGAEVRSAVTLEHADLEWREHKRFVDCLDFDPLLCRSRVSRGRRDHHREHCADNRDESD